MEEQYLYRSLTPLIYLSKLLGITNLTTSSRGNRLVLSRFNALFSITKAAVFVGCFFYAIADAQSAKESDDSDNSISQATGLFDLYAGIITQTATILLNCINTKRLIGFFQAIGTIDKRISFLGVKVTTCYNRRFVIYGIVAILVEFVMTFGSDYLLFIENESAIYLITSYYTIIPNGIMKIQLITFIFLLLQRFGALNMVLGNLKSKMMYNKEKNSMILLKPTLKLVRKAVTSDAEVVAMIHNIYSELCELCALINFLYGVQLLLAMSSTFVVCANEVYDSYTIIKYNTSLVSPLTEVYFNCQWAFVQFLEIFAIIVFAERTHAEAKKTTFKIHELHHAQHVNEELKIEIQEFCIHMTHKAVKFNVCGFFKIDYNLIKSMFGGITSYIVIIIQFDIAKNSISTKIDRYEKSLTATINYTDQF